MWDAHCHLDDPRLCGEIESVLSHANEMGVEGMICAGFSPKRWLIQSELALNYPEVLVAYGLHPWVVAAETPAQANIMLEELSTVLESNSFAPPIGLGEMGLDRSQRVSRDSIGWQTDIFRKQLAMARSLSLPIILHVVQAHGMMLDILKQDGIPDVGGLVHGFSGSSDVALAYNRLGLHVSFGGILTQTGAQKAKAAAASVDDRWLLCETDAPDMTPASMGDVPNQPGYLPLVVDALASIRGVSFEHIASMTQQNTIKLFDL